MSGAVPSFHPAAIVLASQAVTAWKLLKKQADSVTKVQAARLEQAMVNQNRWQRNEFEQRLVQHPLMSYLVQGLVWARYEEGGDRPIVFRIAEDRTYTDIDDEPCMNGTDGSYIKRSV